MELSIVEFSVYVPPMIVGILFYIYRKSMLSFNPLAGFEMIRTIVSNQLTQRVNQILEVLTVGSRVVRQVITGIQLKTMKLLQGPLVLYQKIQATFQNLTFQFEVVKIQFSNFTQSAFQNISNFFNPPEKSLWEVTYIPVLLVTSLLAIGLIYWYFRKETELTIPNPEYVNSDTQTIINTPIEKKPIRRKRRT